MNQNPTDIEVSAALCHIALASEPPTEQQYKDELASLARQLQMHTKAVASMRVKLDKAERRAEMCEKAEETAWFWCGAGWLVAMALVAYLVGRAM